jgi:methionyl-tRNA formyltransferase
VRLAYLGSPEAACPPLEALLEAGHDVVLVVTRPERRRSRRGAPEPTPVGRLAEARGIPVSHRLDDVLGVAAELGVVVAYGRIVPPHVLERLPMLNVHFSLLPRWRGAAPVERAILAGDEVTGVTLFWLDEGLDTGPVVASRQVAIEPGEDAASLTRRLALLGAGLLVETLAHGLEGIPEARPQEGTPTEAPKLSPDELRLDFFRPAEELERVVRLGRAWTTVRGGRLRVLRARAEPAAAAASMPPGSLVDGAVVTGCGLLRLEVVQPEGRRAMPADAWLRGARLAPGERLGAQPTSASAR